MTILKKYDLLQTLLQGFEFTVSDCIKELVVEVNLQEKYWLTMIVYDSEGKVRGQFIHGNSSNTLTINCEVEKDPRCFAGSLPDGDWKVEILIENDKTKGNRSIDQYDLITIGHIVIKSEEALDEREKTFHEKGENRSYAQLESLVPNGKNNSIISRTNFNGKKQYNFFNNIVFKNDSCWYKGDFHTHTVYSDGQMKQEENICSAINQGLDFFVATDHNLVPSYWVDNNNFLVIPGTELTSIFGHTNLIGTYHSPFQDNSLFDLCTNQGMNRLIRSRDEDTIFSINHPFLTQWKWLFRETLLEDIDTIEIINDPTYYDNNLASHTALKAWNLLLNDGFKITGIGGSDSHMRPGETYEGSLLPSLIGDPITYVYANNLSCISIVSGVKSGKVVVSRIGFIDFQIDGKCPGDKIKQSQGIAQVSIDADSDFFIQWIVNGKIVNQVFGSKSKFRFDFTNIIYAWIRVDIYSHDGNLYGFTNPIYYGEKNTSMETWGQILDLIEEEKIND